MSLLQRGTETVVVFPEEVYTDGDGNTLTRASATGVVCRAVVQPLGVVGAQTETQVGGFQTTSKYRLRIASGYPGRLGAQSAVEWQGRRYSIDGEPRMHNGSPRTAYTDYVMARS